MLNRHALATALATIVFCTTITNEAFATPFQVGDFVTYSQDNWGGNPSLDDGAGLLALNFNLVYGGGIEVGVAGNAGHSMIFTSAAHVLNYLPAGGPPAPLNSDLIDPTSPPAGLFGGFVLALQLNVDFADAGLLTGSGGIPFGDLTIVNLTPYPDLNGLSSRQFLAVASKCLGAGSCPLAYDDVAAIAQDLSLAFESGTPTQFAQDHLQLADSVPQPVPEPTTLSLLGIGLLATLTARRFKRSNTKRRNCELCKTS
jgi:hypothetical protein